MKKKILKNQKKEKQKKVKKKQKSKKKKQKKLKKKTKKKGNADTTGPRSCCLEIQRPIVLCSQDGVITKK